MHSTSLSRELVEGLLQTNEDTLSEASESVTTRILDTLGAALSAAAVGEGTAGARAMARRGNPGKATFWGSGGARGPASEAALANGMLCHAMDYDDTHTGAVMHPSGIVIPAAFAVSEHVGATGGELLAAAAIGYEVAIRLGRGAPGVFQTRGFQGSAILGPFAAALVAGKLMQAGPDTIINAWGVAGSMASGINEFHSDGSGSKQLHLGWAAHNGITAVELALNGATGPATVLEGRDGIYSNFGGVEVDRTAVLDGLGDRFLIGEVASKPYPACHCVHPVIDSWFQIAREHAVEATQVERITCLVPEWYVGIILEPRAAKWNPATTYARRFSLPYCLGRAVLDGWFGLNSFSGPVASDLRNVMERIDHEIVEYEEFPRYFPGGVRVTLKDGRVLESILRHHRGSDMSPPDFAETTSKIMEAAALIGSDGAGESLIDAIVGLGQAPDLSELARAMSAFQADLTTLHR